jgi:hypothetical protein
LQRIVLFYVVVNVHDCKGKGVINGSGLNIDMFLSFFRRRCASGPFATAWQSTASPTSFLADLSAVVLTKAETHAKSTFTPSPLSRNSKSASFQPPSVPGFNVDLSHQIEQTIHGFWLFTNEPKTRFYLLTRQLKP